MILGVCLLAALMVFSCKKSTTPEQKDEQKEEEKKDEEKKDEEKKDDPEPEPEFSLEVAIDGDFAEWDTLTADTADGENYIYEENSNSALTGMLRLKLASDEDNIYVYTELNYENIFVADGGPYAQGGSWTGFLGNPHPGTPGALIIYVGADDDDTGAYAARAIGEDESMWDYTGFDAFPQYYFCWDVAANKMQFGWNQNNWPQNHGYDPEAKEDWWGKPLGAHGDGWWGDDVEGTPVADNTVSDESSFKFSGIEKVKDPVSKAEVSVIKIEFAMDRSAINEDGAKVNGKAVIGAFYEQVGETAAQTSAQGSGKLPSGNKAVTLKLK